MTGPGNRTDCFSLVSVCALIQGLQWHVADYNLGSEHECECLAVNIMRSRQNVPESSLHTVPCCVILLSASGSINVSRSNNGVDA